MPPGCPDTADAAGCRPPSNRLRVYSEERSHLPGSEKALIVPIHVLPLLISVTEHAFSVAKTSVYFLVFPKNEPLVFAVSFRQARPAFAGRGAGGGWAHPDGRVRESRPRGVTIVAASRGVCRPITECATALLTRCD